MLLHEVDGMTYCPGTANAYRRHLPRTQDGSLCTMSYISSDAPAQPRTVIIAECRQLAEPPAEAPHEAALFEPCPQCMAARAGAPLPVGYTVADSMGHHRINLTAASAS